MALNPHHLVEELGGTKCSIIEKNASSERVTFIKKILEHNGLVVVVEKSPAPKNTAKTETSIQEPIETYTVGVTDYTFNLTHAIFARSLFTPEGKILTLTYWKESNPNFAENQDWYWKN